MIETQSGLRPVAFFEGPDANEHAASFAAAPDLLEALRNAIEVMELALDRAANGTERGVISARLDAAMLAIARADGREILNPSAAIARAEGGAV